MALEVNGKSIETDENGNLTDPSAWDEDVAKALAAEDNIELTQEHWDVINYLRSEYIDNKTPKIIIKKDMIATPSATPKLLSACP